MSAWDDFWSIVWIFFWGFALVAYLMALFSVVGDLFRDHGLNGWWKALWIVCLIFLPFITVLVYVIARGRGMAERSSRVEKDAREARNAYIRDVAGTSANPTSEIASAKALLDSGTITADEFARIKAHALGTTRG